jgi:hypothetical protein
MSYKASLSELTDFLLRKFMRYLGGPSNYAQTQRDMRETLNSLQEDADESDRSKLLSQLEGQAFILNTVSYYNNKELEEIVDKINSIRKELVNGKDF